MRFGRAHKARLDFKEAPSSPGSRKDSQMSYHSWYISHGYMCDDRFTNFFQNPSSTATADASGTTNSEGVAIFSGPSKLETRNV